MERNHVRERINKSMNDNYEIIQKMRQSEKIKKTMEDIAQKMITCYNYGGKVVAFGNGGSAADAQHLVGELQNKFRFDRPGLAAIALSANIAVLTATGNDYNYETTFAKQVEGFVKPGDIVIGISTSGNAKNVLKAFEQAKKQGAINIFFTGENGGLISTIAQKTALIDITLNIPSNDTPRIQEGHELVYHTICELVEAALFGDAHA